MAAGDDNRNRRTDSDVKKILLTSLSAMIAETTTFPIDLIKTRLQLHGESLPSTRQASAFRIVFQIAKDDGVFGLYRGLSPAVVRHFFYTPIRIVGYEHLRNLVSSYDNSPSLFSKAVMGGVSGVIAQVFIHSMWQNLNESIPQVFKYFL